MVLAAIISGGVVSLRSTFCTKFSRVFPEPSAIAVFVFPMS